MLPSFPSTDGPHEGSATVRASVDAFLLPPQRAHAEGSVHLIDLVIDSPDNHRILDEHIRPLSAAV